MRFPLLIPPLLLLILNWPSLDSDAVALHNGSFVAVNPLDHVQSANITSIDGNFTTRNSRFRNSSTYYVKPSALADTDVIHTVSTHQDSSGKRQKRNSQEDELAQAEKNVTDLTSEISKISQELKEKEEEASEANKNCAETKNEWDRQEQLLEVWKEWEAADEAAADAESELIYAKEKVDAANDSVIEAQTEYERVENEPKRQQELKLELPKLNSEKSKLDREIRAIKIPQLESAVTRARNAFNSQKSEVDRIGCSGPGKESASSCTDALSSLNALDNALKAATTALENGKRDLPIKKAEHKNCTDTIEAVTKELKRLEISVNNYKTNLNAANQTRVCALADQVHAQETYDIALKSRNETAETLKIKETAKTKSEESGSGSRDAIEAAITLATVKFTRANATKERIDREIGVLKTTLGEKNVELDQANAKVEALKQSKKDEPKTGATMYIGMGVGGGILVIILVIGGIIFAVKRRKSKVKEEPSPTINPDALKYEKVAALEKSRQETATQSNSTQRVTAAKSDTNVAANQPNSAPETGPTAVPPKSNANDKPAPLGRGKNEEYRPPPPKKNPITPGPSDPAKPEVKTAPLVKHEKIAEHEVTHIDPCPLLNEVVMPTSDSGKPGGSALPHGKQKWAKTKAIAMRGGGEALEPLPDDSMLHGTQDEEQMEQECADTQYERSTTDKLTKRTGAALLDEHPEDKLTVAMAAPIAAMIMIAVSRMLDIPYGTLKQTMVAVREILKTEKMLVTCGVPAVIFGDVHGQVGDLTRLLSLVAYDAANPSRKLDLNGERFVFCGDYVDRGNRQVEVLELLFCLKLMYPNNVFLVRGNHETRDINLKHGFRDELEKRYGEDEGHKLYEMYNEVFAHLPIACVVGGQVLAVHGGISPLLTKLEDINNIPKPLYNISDSQLAQDILWADPMNGLSGTKPNNVRGISNYFGEDTLDAALKRLGLSMVVCGHRIPRNGFAAFSDKLQLFTVFTATNAGSGKKNSGAALRIFKDFTIQAIIIHKCYSEAIYGVTHNENNKLDDDYAVLKEAKEEPALNMLDTIYPDFR